MNKYGKLQKQVIVVSIFSGMDLFLYGMMIAGMKGGYAVEFNKYAAAMHAFNFSGPDGKPLLRWVFVDAASMKKKLTKKKDEKKEKKRKQELRNHYILNEDGSAKRPEAIQDVDGRKVRQICHELYGDDIYIVLIGGPSCKDFTKLHVHNDGKRNQLVWEYLRFFDELQPDVAVMEEVTDLLREKYRDIYTEFLTKAKECGYRVAYQKMNSLHYDGVQDRWRLITMMVKESLDKHPVFPEPKPESAKRAGEVFDLDHFYSGHFEAKVKNADHYMCTVTSSSPEWFSKRVDGKPVYRSPSPQELLCAQGLKEGMEYKIPEGTPLDQQKLAIGNAVPINMAYHIGRVIMEMIFDLPVENEY